MANKRKIFFRADASADIGYGHFVRTLALADMLKENFECTYFTSNPTDYMRQEIEKVCTYVALNEESKLEDFLHQLLGDETVVLDNYFYTPEYQLRIKEKGCRLVCIDDMHDRQYYADIVINHATGLNRSDYDLEPYTQLCTGLDWSLLRKEFINYKPSAATTKRDIFVCFGGSDFCNITTKVLEAISLNEYNCTIHVVLGEANKQRDVLFEIYKDSKVKFYSSLSAKQMIDIMSICKIGIIPASGLLWESLKVGLPSIYGYYVDNQMDICLHNPTIEQSICIGDYNAISIDDLAKHIDALYKKTISTEYSLQRDIKANYNQLFANTLTCRRAEIHDCDLYYEWANDPVTRAMAFSKKPIPYENHCKWFSEKILSEDAVLYIFYFKGNPIGQVRFDIEDGEAEIDISIDKCFRGKQLGTQMLSQAVFWFSLDKPGINPVSTVLAENPASKRIFEKCGFVKVSQTKKYYKYEFHHTI